MHERISQKMFRIFDRFVFLYESDNFIPYYSFITSLTENMSNKLVSTRKQLYPFLLDEGNVCQSSCAGRCDKSL